MKWTQSADSNCRYSERSLGKILASVFFCVQENGEHVLYIFPVNLDLNWFA